MDIVESPREWLIRKGSLYYRPNSAGYTGIKAAAGRYTQAEAELEAAVEPGHIVAVHQDRVPDDPVPAAEAAATITALRKRVEELEGALKPFALVAERDIGSDETDDDYFRPVFRNAAPRLTVGHFRAALRAKGGEHGDA